MPGRGNRQLERHLGLALARVKLDAWQPPRRKARVDPERLGGVHGRDAAGERMARELRRVVAVGKREGCARRTQLRAHVGDALGDLTQRLGLALARQDRMAQCMRTDRESRPGQASRLLPRHRLEVGMGLEADAMARARAIETLLDEGMRKRLDDVGLEPSGGAAERPAQHLVAVEPERRPIAKIAGDDEEHPRHSETRELGAGLGRVAQLAVVERQQAERPGARPRHALQQLVVVDEVEVPCEHPDVRAQVGA